MRRRSAARPEVLLSVRPEDLVENPYVSLFESSLAEQCLVRRFTWGRALFGTYDVFHVHWPETLLRSHLRSKAVVYRVLTLVLLLRLRLRHVPMFRTVHNLHPHESASRVERAILAAIDRATTVRIYLNTSEPFDERGFGYLIPHGDYHPWYGHGSPSSNRSSTILFFGRLRGYKGVDILLEAFAGLDDLEWRLQVMGRPEDERTADELTRRAAQDPRVEVTLGAATDDDLSAAVAGAEVCVFPYSRFYNSGAVLLALSLGTPVVVPRCPAASELAVEVGPEWVIEYEPPLTPPGLADALHRARSAPRSTEPVLRGRDWAEQAPRLAALYRQHILLARER